MPRFPVAFGKRKSGVSKEDGELVPSFRVLDRTEAVGVKTFNGHPGTGRPVSTARPYSQVDNLAEEENMFSNLKMNRYVVSLLSHSIFIPSSFALRSLSPACPWKCVALPVSLSHLSISRVAVFSSHFAGMCRLQVAEQVP